MRTRVRCLLFLILFFIIGMVNANARPSRADDNSKLAGEHSTGSFNSRLVPLSMLLVGAGLVVFGGVLRRRLRSQV